MNEFTVKAKDGALIQGFADGLDAPLLKGIVVVCHGFGEHGGSYHELAENLAQAHYACIRFDQRGHGGFQTDAEKRKKLQGIIPDYEYFLDDLGTVCQELREQYPTIPIVLYGHSMGGNIVVNYLLRRTQTDITAAVLESPWLGLYKDFSPLLKKVARFAGNLMPQLAIVNKLVLSDITADPVKIAEMKDDPLYHNRISLKMFTGINEGCEYALKHAAQLTVPVYLTYAQQEKIVSNSAIKQFADHCPEILTVKSYESCHAIHNDRESEQYYQDVITFLDRHCCRDD